MMNYRKHFVVGIALLLISAILYFFYNNTDLSKLSFLPKKFEIPLVTQTSPNEEYPAVWVWLGSTEVINDSGNYYLAGNIGNKNNLSVKIFLGSEDTDVGYASSTDWGSQDANFPERFPEWTEQPVSKIEVDSASSNYAIVKILTVPITPSQSDTCDEYCNMIVNKQAELLENNQKISTINSREKLDGLVIGPAIQVLQILEI